MRRVVRRISFKHEKQGPGPTIHADIPVWSCSTCGGSYPTSDAEDAKRDAVYAHYERLRPTEIIKVRRSIRLSQLAFAKKLGVGRSAIARWETGDQMQSEAYDKAIRQLTLIAEQ